jgi:CAAX protease family protein
MNALFAKRHPYWFITGVEVVVVLVYLAAGTIAYFAGLGSLEVYGMANVGLAVLLAATLTRLGWWVGVGFRQPERMSDLWYFLLPLLSVLANFVPEIQIPEARILLQIFAVTLAVGFVEEGVFRGLMLHALEPRGVWSAAVITSLVFGVTHAMNLMVGRSVAETAAQVMYTVALGFAFAALVLRKRLIWPLVLIHFLVNFIAFLVKPGYIYPPGWELVIALGLTVVFAAYGMFVMLHAPVTPARQAYATAG